MGSATLHLVCPCATWCLGYRNESGIFPRSMRRVALDSTLALDPPKHQVAHGCTQSLGGARVFWAPYGVRAVIANQAFCQDLNTKWCSGLPLARARSPCAMWCSICPVQGSDNRSANYPCVGSTKYSLPMTCSLIKTCANNFLPNHPFDAKCWKDNFIPPLLPLQLFVSRVGLPLHYSNPQYFVSM